MPPFRTFAIQDSLSAETGSPAELRTWQSRLDLPGSGTHFVYAARGATRLHRDVGRDFILEEGMVASIPGSATLLSESSDSGGMVVTHRGYRGLFLLSGPIEKVGRLRYIDGCSDSLVIPPPVQGDPCLNHLHIPANVHQTRHVHPSVRIGIVARGAGRCLVGSDVVPLTPGLVFVLAPEVSHCFHTDAEPLDVVVYHPDTDTGPTDEDHPMRNRTLFRDAVL